MSETFKLHGTINISKDEALKALGQTVTEAETTRDKIADAFDKIGGYAEIAGARIGEAFRWGFDQIKQLTIEGMNVSGAVEQGVGGAEAVFGKYADKIEEKAAKAYESMGLSAAQYYKEANKMGSLFIGMEYSQAEAAEMTTTAMQRAADVAAIMGIDLEWAMYSVAGMAKGNYMMMDNLGVAMNATTLEAYALEKGINKSWKEMTKVEQIGIAYEMFLERTAYAMGRYTEENNTYSGSINTAKAAWENFISGQMSMEEAFPHIKNAFDITLDRLTEILPHIVDGLDAFIDLIEPYIDPILGKLIPIITNAARKIISAVIHELPGIIIECAPALLEAWDLIFAYLGGKTLLNNGASWLGDLIRGGGSAAGAGAAAAGGAAAGAGAGAAAAGGAAAGAGAGAAAAGGAAAGAGAGAAAAGGAAAGAGAGVAATGKVVLGTLGGAAGAFATALGASGILAAIPALWNKLTDPESYNFEDSEEWEKLKETTDYKVDPTKKVTSPARMNELMRNMEKREAEEEQSWFDQFYGMFNETLPEGFSGSGGYFGKPGASIFDALGQYVSGKGGGLIGNDITPLTTLLTNLNAKLDTVINYQAQGKTIVLNTGALVGGIGGAMDQQLGRMFTQKTRG